MKSDDTLAKTKNLSTKNQESSQSISVTRRRFLAAGVSGVAGLGILGSLGRVTAATNKHTLVVEGFGPTTSYSFTVGGNLQKSTASGASINNSDQINGPTVHGAVSNGKDAYTFTGPFYAFDFDQSGKISVTLDGEPAHVGNQFDHVLLIEGFGTNTPYSFSVTDSYQKSGAYGASINKKDASGPLGGHGVVGSGKDAYLFDGDLRAFDFDRSGELRATIDGRPAHVGNRPDHELFIYGIGDYRTRSPYEFSVSGPLHAARGANEKNDKITGKSASGAVVSAGADYYVFDGELTSLKFPGKHSPIVYNNGKQIHENDV